MGASSISRPMLSVRKTLTACATISGPMPSPGNTAIFMQLFQVQLVKQPGLRRAVLRLEFLDFVHVSQRQADIVEAIEQAVFAMRIHIEAKGLAGWSGNGLLFQ